MSPYREAAPASTPAVHCPRCAKPLSPVDVARCTCGVWVTAFAATEVFTAAELRADPITHWWRVRAACPMCGEQMLLRGDEPGHFQGCDGHGFWVDADDEHHTGLARGIPYDAIDRKRQDEIRVDAEREARHKAETQRAAQRAEKDRLEAVLALAIEGEPSVVVGSDLEIPTLDDAVASRARASTHKQRELAAALQREAAAAADALEAAIGRDAARYFLRRLEELERRIRELETRY